jgi:tetratricopeptide (TPR) repeat protein
MRILFFIAGIILFSFGLVYLCWPKVILKINESVRKIFFNDVKSLLNRKKIGLIYILASVIIFYFGINISVLFRVDIKRDELLLREIIRIKLYRAYRQYYLHNYDNARDICHSILIREPNNIRALELTGLVHFAEDEHMKARPYFKKVLKLNPDNSRIRKIFESTYKEKQQ